MYTQYTLYTGGVYCVYSAISRLSADTEPQYLHASPPR